MKTNYSFYCIRNWNNRLATCELLIGDRSSGDMDTVDCEILFYLLYSVQSTLNIQSS